MNIEPPAAVLRVRNPTVSRSKEGRRIFNDTYEILGLLGQGAFGKVKGCKDVKTGKYHAVKIYHTAALLRKKTYSNFCHSAANGSAEGDSGPRIRVRTALDKVFEEIKLLQSIGHGSCVGLQDVLHFEGKMGKWYLVFELMELGRLMHPADEDASEVRRRGERAAFRLPQKVGGAMGGFVVGELGPTTRCRAMECLDEPCTSESEDRNLQQEVLVLCEEVVRCLARDVAAALAYLHSSDVRIAHRDVKPDNILLGCDGHAKLGDFGVAGRMDETFRVRGTEGTYHFMSPESCAPPDESMPYLGHDGRAADVWALGVSLWAMLFGTLPFDGESLEELFDNIVEAKWEFPSDCEVSEECRHVLQRILCKDNRSRISAAELLVDPWIADADQRYAMSYAQLLEPHPLVKPP